MSKSRFTFKKGKTKTRKLSGGFEASCDFTITEEVVFLNTTVKEKGKTRREAIAALNRIIRGKKAS